jgi:chemotaxis protein methyltransferase CheR
VLLCNQFAGCAERLARRFRAVRRVHCLRADYRRPVHFLEQDIRHAFPQSHFDLMLCRNLVFTYVETSLQAAIAKRLAERLVAGGMILLGIHESLPESIPMLVQERSWLYRTREG